MFFRKRFRWRERDTPIIYSCAGQRDNNQIKHSLYVLVLSLWQAYSNPARQYLLNVIYGWGLSSPDANVLYST